MFFVHKFYVIQKYNSFYNYTYQRSEKLMTNQKTNLDKEMQMHKNN